MATTQPFSELDAVNMMLEGIFEAPINSLDVPGVSDGGLAKRILADTRRQILAKGWHFNTETEVTLSVDTVSGTIPIPNNALRIDASDCEAVDVAQRGLRLYNKTDHTFLFTAPLKADIVYHLEWSDLPEHAKMYISVSAARRFQDSVLGEGQGRYKAGDEEAARALMQDAEGDDADHNILSGSYTVSSILER